MSQLPHECVKGASWVLAELYVPVLTGAYLVLVGFTISTADPQSGQEECMISCLEHINTRVLGKEKVGVNTCKWEKPDVKSKEDVRNALSPTELSTLRGRERGFLCGSSIEANTGVPELHPYGLGCIQHAYCPSAEVQWVLCMNH